MTDEAPMTRWARETVLGEDDSEVIEDGAQSASEAELVAALKLRLVDMAMADNAPPSTIKLAIDALAPRGAGVGGQVAGIRGGSLRVFLAQCAAEDASEEEMLAEASRQDAPLAALNEMYVARGWGAAGDDQGIKSSAPWLGRGLEGDPGAAHKRRRRIGCWRGLYGPAIGK